MVGEIKETKDDSVAFHVLDEDLPVKSSAVQHPVLVNISPLITGHVLFIVHCFDCLPQILTERALAVGFQIAHNFPSMILGTTNFHCPRSLSMQNCI